MTFEKRLAAPKHYPIERKGKSYVARIEGSRSSENAIPAALFLREVVGYADTFAEAKEILHQEKVKRNGEVLRDPRQGIGILDVVELNGGEAYRVIQKGDRLEFVPVDDAEKVLARVEDKHREEDEYVYNLHNGENYRTKDEFETGSSLVFPGPEEVQLEEGATVLVVDGQHAGEVAEVSEIRERKMQESTGLVESGFEFETPLENLVAVKDIQLGDTDE